MLFKGGMFGGTDCLRSFRKTSRCGGKTKSCQSLNPSTSSESSIFSTKDSCMKPDMLKAVCFMDAVYVL